MADSDLLSVGTLKSVMQSWIGSAGSNSTSGTGYITTSGEIKATSFTATSDINKKENLKGITDIDLTGIKAYKYNFKGQSEDKVHIGLIAQDVEKMYPEAVNRDAEGSLSLDYNSIVALLVDKVNELEKKVEELSK